MVRRPDTRLGVWPHVVACELPAAEDPFVLRGHEGQSGALLVGGLSRVVPPLREASQHLLPRGEDGFPGGLTQHAGDRLGDVALELLNAQDHGRAGQLAEQHPQPVVDGVTEAVPCRGVDVERLQRVRQPGQAREVVAADGFHVRQVPAQEGGDRGVLEPQLVGERQVDQPRGVGALVGLLSDLLLVVVQPGHALDVQDVHGAGDGDVGQARLVQADRVLVPLSSVGGRSKPWAMRTRGHSRPLALCAVETITCPLPLGARRSTASMMVSGPYLSTTATRAFSSPALLSFSTYSCTSPQESNKNSSGCEVRLPSLSCCAASAMRLSGPPPPHSSTRMPSSRWDSTSRMAWALERHKTASGWGKVATVESRAAPVSRRSDSACPSHRLACSATGHVHGRGVGLRM
jgi:hypothetical protein